MEHPKLNEAQSEILGNFVASHTVYDLGAGDCTLANCMLFLGADRVIAVDKVRYSDYPDFLPLRFSELLPQLKTIDIAFIAWPMNSFNPSLLSLIKRSKIVIYLGSNTNGNACGDPKYFEEFRHRELLAYSPNHQNTLIVYGDYLDSPRNFEDLRGEEFAAITIYQQSRALLYDEIERRHNPKDRKCDICWQSSCICVSGYKKWLQEINRLLEESIGMGREELPADYMWADAYQEGFTPTAAINILVGPLHDPSKLLEAIYLEGSGLGDLARKYKIHREELLDLAEEIFRKDLGSDLN